MNDELMQKLVLFKQVTIELISALKKNEIINLDDLLNSRQIVIKDMEKLTYTSEEFTGICNELDILNLQEELVQAMQAKKDSTKEELIKIQITRNANINYNKNFYNNVGMFNKKI